MRSPLLLVVLLAVAGCTETAPPRPDGGSNGTSIVLADRDEPTTLNPLLGYGAQGVSKIYDGLVEHRQDGSLTPQLAADLPQPAADGLSWTVKLRGDVKFTDGSTFGAEDVVATYTAALQNPIKDRFSTLKSVEQVDPSTVRFTLTQTQAAFPHLLVLGVLPSEQANPDGQPVGTGPYKVVEWKKGDRLLLESNEGYFDGAPKVKKVTIVFVADDNQRAGRMQEGEFDGTVLPPKIATQFAARSGLQVNYHRSADYRAVRLPAANPVTGNASVRLALNFAANRQGMIDSLLDGKGTIAYTPVPDALAEEFDPTAKFRFDKTEATRLLDVGGWVPGADGIRVREGVAARFTLMYPLGDDLRADLATAFAADAKAVGVDVQLAGLSWEAIRPRMAQDALLYGEGSPFDPDLMLYDLRGQGSPAADAALENGRRLIDPAQRAVAYKLFQQAFVAAPSMAVLVFPEHAYVMRDSWNGYQPVVDPNSYGALAWGPWWNLEKWEPK
ncbi:ABC transporter substrate-binding protein [Lentzea sp. BCCO 10_0798]|uniref:ABC transporter substrate-binding protein n=1 Tax=Lentzea kristufekii TaxID=3095430 RepID=A0ABU4TIG6_9PSEU|nr:ABC transporter substrate-binding protein [Lentzea sp. BCCO 10_0798]MDX8048071.1 ABC transporter substrate-binding protein [Lentzea sp. BCCO 10_0798]